MNTLVVDCPPTHRGSKITWCGEAPGEEEQWLKEGFVGKAGKVLASVASVGGIELDSCNKTNVSKRRPVGNDFSVFYAGKEPTEELRAWHEELRKELIEHRPNVVVACGNEALFALTGLREITKRQGSVYQSTLVPGLKVVAMQHPSSILHNHKWMDAFLSSRIVERVVLPESRAAQPVLTPAPWEEHLGISVPAFREVVRQAIAEQWRWVIDIETRGGGIACVGVGFAPRGRGREIAVIVPIETTTGPYYTTEHEYEFWCLLQELSDGNARLVLQNAVFDLAWLMEYGFVPDSVFMDTMTAHHQLYAELPQSLEVLNFFYPTGIPYYKNEGKTWGKTEPDESLWTYCCKDLVSELRVSFSIEDELRKRGLFEKYQAKTMPLLWIALEMQERGFGVWREELRDTRGLVQEELARVTAELTKAAGREVNIGSPLDVPSLLYKELRFSKLYGKSNADEDVLVTLKSWLVGQKPMEHTKKCNPAKCSHRSVDELERMRVALECVMRGRKLLKARSSYLAPGLYAKDEWVQFGWRPEATETFRWASNIHPRGLGFNGQTEPKAFRFMLHAGGGSRPRTERP